MRSLLFLLGLLGLPACSEGEVRPGNGQFDADLTVSEVVIEPDDPTTTSELTARATVIDARNRDFTVDYTWLVDDQIVQQGATDTLAPASFVRDQLVVVEAVAAVGNTVSAPVRSAPVQIRNTPPTLETVAIDPPQPTSADTITCVASGMADLDGDTVTLTYRWFIDGTPLELNDSRLPSRTVIRDQTLACEATPTDGTDAGEPVRSTEVLVGNGPPFIASVLVEPRPAFTTSLLTAVPSVSDPDGDPISITWQWTVNGSPSGTTSGLSPDRFVRGDVVQVTARAFDGELESNPRTSEPLTIANSPPTAPEVELLPVIAAEGDPLQCAITRASTDPDGDALSYLIDFFRDGDPYTGPTTTTARPDDTVPGDQVREGEVWTCAAQAWDRTDTSPASPESAPVLIGPPLVEIDIPLAALVNQGVACGTHARYNGGCSGAYGFAWVDEAEDPPREVEIYYNHSVSCSSSTAPRAATLNGASIGTAPIGDERNCTCASDAPRWERVVRLESPESYLPSARNVFLMSALSCEGFAINADWARDDGTPIYARVILRY